MHAENHYSSQNSPRVYRGGEHALRLTFFLLLLACFHQSSAASLWSILLQIVKGENKKLVPESLFCAVLLNHRRGRIS